MPKASGPDLTVTGRVVKSARDITAVAHDIRVTLTRTTSNSKETACPEGPTPLPRSYWCTGAAALQ